MYFCPSCNIFADNNFCKGCASHALESPFTDPLQVINSEYGKSIIKILTQGSYLILLEEDEDRVTSVCVIDDADGKVVSRLDFPQLKVTSISSLGSDNLLYISFRCEDLHNNCGSGVYLYRLPDLVHPLWSWGKDLIPIIAPILHNEKVFVVTNDRKLHILDVISGDELIYQYLEVSSNISSMIANDDTLFLLGQSPHIRAFSINQQVIEWEVECIKYEDSRSGFLNPVLYGGNICIVLDNGAILCAGRGKINWEQPPQELVKNISQMYSIRNKCLITDCGGVVCALDIQTGKIIWKNKICGKVNHVSHFAENLLTISSEDGGIYIINSDTGELVWRYQDKDTNLPVETHETKGNKIFACYLDGSIRLYLFPPNLDTLEKKGFNFVLQKSYQEASACYEQAGKSLDAKRLTGAISHQTFKEITDRIVTTGERERISRLNTRENSQSLFSKNGLCAGQEQTDTASNCYFLGHEFSREKMSDLRSSLIEALGPDLRPYTVDMEIASKLRLCRIASKIQTSLFCIFDLPEGDDENVYLEIGLAIGLKRKFYLIHKASLQPPDSLSGFGPIPFSSYTGLKHEIKDKEESFLVFREDKNLHENRFPKHEQKNCYLISPGGPRKEDFISAVKKALGKYKIVPMILGQSQHNYFKLDLLIEQVRNSSFGIYQINIGNKPDNFIALGIAIGMGRPFLLISEKGKGIPSDLQGLDCLEYSATCDLQIDLTEKSGSFFDNYVRCKAE